MKLMKTKRRKYFKYLGLGEYNKSNILKLQKAYFDDPKEWDGKYGVKTDILLRHVYNVKKNSVNFRPEEFKCPCGHCTGYPTQIRARLVRNAQTIRNKYGKSMTITSGLRCAYQNKKVNGSKDSRHLLGRAIDFYIPNVTDTLSSRKKVIKFLKTLPHHRYSYGNGYNSYGNVVYAPNMGNALHTDVR